jgi:hypothetical protein
MFQTVTLAYDAKEDRIIAATDIGGPDGWSCWLTRRLVRAFLVQAADYVARTSPLAAKAAAHHRDELVAFERDAALDKTAPALSRTDNDAVALTKVGAELATSVTIQARGPKFRLELRGDRGGEAVGDLSRPIFQRILQVLAEEAARGEWLGDPKPAATPAAAAGPAAKPIRH